MNALGICLGSFVTSTGSPMIAPRRAIGVPSAASSVILGGVGGFSDRESGAVTASQTIAMTSRTMNAPSPRTIQRPHRMPGLRGGGGSKCSGPGAPGSVAADVRSRARSNAAKGSSGMSGAGRGVLRNNDARLMKLYYPPNTPTARMVGVLPPYRSPRAKSKPVLSFAQAGMSLMCFDFSLWLKFILSACLAGNRRARHERR